MEMQLAAARWSLGYLRSEQLPQIALAGLEAGLDSPAMQVLAGESQPILSEVGPLFEQMLAELGVVVPPQPAAAVYLACCIAQEILAGTKAPSVGAREIWMLALDCEEAQLPNTFAGLASEYEDFTDQQHLKHYGAEHCKQVLEATESAIREEARCLLTMHG